MHIDLKTIEQSQTPPPLFKRGAPMWNDPYIAKQMLNFHLGESHDIASRRPEIINTIVTWIHDTLSLSAGKALLDLGCGPGLYTRRFAQRGLQVTGVDFSENSIDYAMSQDSDSTYICQDYTSLDLPDNAFDVVMMIYGDFCVLSDSERDNLLANVRRWLKPDGAFVFDVTTPKLHAYLEHHRTWFAKPEGGFWTDQPYMVLEQGFAYPEQVRCEQFIVMTDDGSHTLYRNWYRDYTPDTITPILQANGYNQIETYTDLAGTPYTDDSEWCGVIARQ